jgi:potassium-transporting ATPase KdpC subunit
MKRDFSLSIFNKIVSKDVRIILRQSLNPSLRIVILMILATGIAYPLLLVLIGDVALPFQSTGSMLTLDGKVVGSKLIAQEFKSEKLFHIRPAANSTSTVDPHISPQDAYAQVPRISKATGLPESTLKTAVEFNIEKNKVSNVLVFAPPYVNALEINIELISGYPDLYHEFSNTNMSGVS